MSGWLKRKPPPQEPSWRVYQERMRRQYFPHRRTRLKRGGPWRVLWLAIGVLVGCWWLVKVGINDAPSTPADEPVAAAAVAPAAQAPDPDLIRKTDVRVLLGNTPLINLETNPVKVTFDGQPYRVETSLDLELQQYLLKKMDRVNSRYIGIVVMASDTGRLIAMAGFNKVNPGEDPCLSADFPAASLFKIVTAAAVVEEKGYTAGSRLKFNGYKHTLYKRQLTDKTNRYTNTISFKDSFAQSVNPVFGKIGALYLDRSDLERYGDAFAFNRQVPFELPWPTSRLAVKDESYQRAEIASGFNRQTTLSPLHGAVIVSAVVNDGVPVEPTLIDRIVDSQGEAVYRSRPRFLTAAMSKETAHVLQQLMHTTVTSGTAHKIFRGHQRNKVLSRLELGGKTGSIFNRAHDARFDWYAGYAKAKKGVESIAVAVVVAHEEYIGIRAGEYARMAIEQYFKNVFARQADTGKDTSG